MIDNRLVGATAENIFLSLVNQKGVFATAFDTAGLDGIVFDPDHKLFKLGQSPYYVQIKCRGANGEKFNPNGFSQLTFYDITARAKSLGILPKSLYFVAGFYNQGDIRSIKFFAIPFSLLPRFKTSGRSQHRFSIQVCERERQADPAIFCL